jgi:hypothetical protein
VTLAFQILVLVFTAGAVALQYLVDTKDNRYSMNRRWRRARILPPVLTVLAVVTQFAVGQIEAQSKEAQLSRMEENIEKLVGQGKLSREDARRVLIPGRPLFKEQLGIKVKPAK